MIQKFFTFISITLHFTIFKNCVSLMKGRRQFFSLWQIYFHVWIFPNIVLQYYPLFECIIYQILSLYITLFPVLGIFSSFMAVTIASEALQSSGLCLGFQHFVWSYQQDCPNLVVAYTKQRYWGSILTRITYDLQTSEFVSNWLS